MKKQTSRISKYLLTLVLALIMVLGVGKAMEVQAAEGAPVELPFVLTTYDSNNNVLDESIEVLEGKETDTLVIYESQYGDPITCRMDIAKVSSLTAQIKISNASGNTYFWKNNNGRAGGTQNIYKASNPTNTAKYFLMPTEEDDFYCFQYRKEDRSFGYLVIKFVKKTADEEAAESVIDLIDNLYNYDEEYTKADLPDAVVAARVAYEELTEAQKELVTNYDVLTEAEQYLEDQAAVDAVIEKIQAIGTVSLNSKDKIQDARKALDALTEDQMYILDDIISMEGDIDYIKSLKDAEAQYAKLEKAAAEKAAAEKKAAEEKAAAEKKAAEEKAAAEKKAAEEAAAAAAKKAATPAKVKSLKVKKVSSKKVKISWKKVKGCSGYEVVMRTGKKGSFKVIKTVKSAKKVTISKAGLKKNKSYTFKVRAYTTVNGEKVYGAYSAAKTVKMK